MRETELLAMSSTATIFKPIYNETALGSQEEVWINYGQTICDVWPITQSGNEQSSGNQEIAEKRYYISVPYNVAINVADKLQIDSIMYDVTFVPIDQSWLTNKRLEARNYNNAINVSGIDGVITLESGSLIISEGN